MSSDPIITGLDTSKRYLSSLHDYIKSQIQNTFLDRIPGVDIIANNIEAQITSAVNVISQAENAIRSQIEPALKNALPGTVTTIIGIAESVQKDIDSLVSNIATTEDVLTTAITTIKHHAPELATWIHNNIAGSFGATALAILKEIETQETEGINQFLDHLLDVKGLPPYLVTILHSFRNRGAEWQALAIPALVIGLILAAVDATFEPTKAALVQSAFNLVPTKEADISTLVSLMFKGGLDNHDFYNRMRNNGINNDVADLMIRNNYESLEPEAATRLYLRGEIPSEAFKMHLQQKGLNGDFADLYALSSRPLLPEDAIRQAFLRGIYSSADHDKALQQYGYQSAQAELLRSLYFYIPGPQDLIHMGIRNVFDPNVVERFGLDKDKPDAFIQAAHAQGINEDWASKYWQAHWVMPGREAFFEMFQRTIDEPIDPHADTIELEDGSHVYNIIGKETLDLALKDIDTPPFYRDLLTQVAYRPLTRIDIRRLNKIGLLNRTGVQRAYLDLGYSLKNATLLAHFTEALNATTSKNEAQTLVTNIQRHVIQLFIQDKLSQDEVESTLKELGFTKAETDIFLEEAKLVRASEYSTAIETGIGRLYQTGRITDKDAIQRLRDADIPEDAITTLMAKWDLAIEYRELPAHIVAHRDLTANEILESLTDGTIDEQSAESMLEAIGYDKNGADTRIGLALFRAAKADRRIQIDAIKSSYVNGVIEQPEASNRLDSLYLPADQRDAYLVEWSLARETRTERIPIATLRDMVKNGKYLTEDEAFAHLKRHRFSDQDARLLLAFWLGNPVSGGSNVSSSGS